MTLAALVVDGTFACCPFCKGTRVRIHEWRSHGTHYAVACLQPGCEARGPRQYDPDDALVAWNAGRPLVYPPERLVGVNPRRQDAPGF